MSPIFLWTQLMAISPAAELAGVEFPEQQIVGSQTLRLNGLGLREKYFIDVYVGALYLPVPSSEPERVMDPSTAKKMIMHFIFPRVPEEKLREVLLENFDNNPQFTEKVKQDIMTCASWMEDAVAGDQLIFEYLPGKGTSIQLRGVHKGVLEDPETMQAIFSLFVGSAPASEQLKRGLLGEG